MSFMELRRCRKSLPTTAAPSALHWEVDMVVGHAGWEGSGRTCQSYTKHLKVKAAAVLPL